MQTISSDHEFRKRGPDGHNVEDSGAGERSRGIRGCTMGAPKPTLEYGERCNTCRWESAFKDLTESGDTAFVYVDTALLDDKPDTPSTLVGFERALIGLTHRGGSNYQLSYFHLTGSWTDPNEVSDIRYQSSEPNTMIHQLGDTREEKAQDVAKIFKNILHEDEEKSRFPGLVMRVLNTHRTLTSGSSFVNWCGNDDDMFTRAATALVDVLSKKGDDRTYPDDKYPFVDKAAHHRYMHPSVEEYVED
jgi:hypothetical protein